MRLHWVNLAMGANHSSSGAPATHAKSNHALQALAAVSIQIICRFNTLCRRIKMNTLLPLQNPRKSVSGIPRLSSYLNPLPQRNMKLLASLQLNTI
jgi:hypothetical protein